MRSSSSWPRRNSRKMRPGNDSGVAQRNASQSLRSHGSPSIEHPMWGLGRSCLSSCDASIKLASDIVDSGIAVIVIMRRLPAPSFVVITSSPKAVSPLGSAQGVALVQEPGTRQAEALIRLQWPSSPLPHWMARIPPDDGSPA